MRKVVDLVFPSDWSLLEGISGSNGLAHVKVIVVNLLKPALSTQVCRIIS